MISATPNLFFFNMEEMTAMGERLHQQYMAAKPFPHIMIDNFLPAAVADQILSEFPKPDDIEWQRFKSNTEKKLATNVDGQMKTYTRHLLAQFNSAAACSFLEKLTGIAGVIPDPHFIGGGLHQIQRSGFLKMHADFNWHDRLRLDRRINLLLYFNKDWKEEYGGHLELWDEKDGKMGKCEQSILPVFNRCAIFTTTSTSYHGHPNPLTCPEGWSRKSMALYYYTQGRPEAEKNASHTTLFQERPGTGETRTGAGEMAKKIIQKLIPPVIFDAARLIMPK